MTLGAMLDWHMTLTFCTKMKMPGDKVKFRVMKNSSMKKMQFSNHTQGYSINGVISLFRFWFCHDHEGTKTKCQRIEAQ